MSRHTQARHHAAGQAGQASRTPTVYMQVAKGYTTVLWQDNAVCCGVVFYVLLTACTHTLHHVGGVI